MTRLGAGLLIVALLGGCHAADSTYQGYVEAEFVDVASSQAGRLETLSVHRGDQVPAQAPLFELDAQPERAQQQQAAQQLAAAQAAVTHGRCARHNAWSCCVNSAGEDQGRIGEF